MKNIKRIFLYIDESKDYKNNLLYMGGLFSECWLHAMNTHCKNIYSTDYELSSTRRPDREWYIKAKWKNKLRYNVYCRKIEWISSDRQYLDALKEYLESFIEKYNPDDIVIFPDYIRLDSDMKKLGKRFSKNLSSNFGKNIELEFLTSSNHLSIQFADLEIGLFRRWE